MLEPKTIPVSPEYPAAMDYAALREEGIAHIQRLAGKLWTDHNIHDPGITTLELICYAITDLGFRTQFPIADLLTPNPIQLSPLSVGNQFHLAHEILPCSPVTVLDWRKLLIDIPGVANAWIQCEGSDCSTEPPVFLDCSKNELTYDVKRERLRIEGIQKIKIQIEPEVQQDPALLEKLKGAIWKTLHAHRNLCEDYCSVEFTSPESIGICAEVLLDPLSDVDEVAAGIIFEIEKYLLPPIYFYSLEELWGNGVTVEEIYSGPLLQHGFLRDSELEGARRRVRLYGSDLINLMMDVPGVSAVRDLRMTNYVEGSPITSNESWCLDLSDQECGYPVFSWEKSELGFFKDSLPFRTHQERVESFLADLRAQTPGKRSLNTNIEIKPPKGNSPDLINYRPLTNDFPAVYGVGEAGLPSDSGEGRKNKARQFKGYLLFFEQVLANYLAQLAQVSDLFSWTEADPGYDGNKDKIPGYASQYIAGIVEGLELFDADGQGNATEVDVEDILNQLSNPGNEPAERRSRFLNHLLARFAEDMTDYSMMLLLSGSTQERNNVRKARFLKDYPEISAGRGKAFDLLGNTNGKIWGSQNVPGMAKRIARKLGIANLERRNLSTPSLKALPISANGYAGKLVFPVEGFVAGEGMSWWVFKNGPSVDFQSPEEIETTVEVLLNEPLSLGAFDQGTHPKNPSQSVWRLVIGSYLFVSEEIPSTVLPSQAEDYLMRLLKWQEEYQTEDGEGLYLVEHILLRPRAMSDPLIEFCIDCDQVSNQESGAEAEVSPGSNPYSWRVSIYLPGYLPRFQGHAFRKFADKQIRLETPAHIQPKICWLSRIQMTEFQEAWKEWLLSMQSHLIQLYQQDSPDQSPDSKPLKRLLEIMKAAKNYFPLASRLHDCEQGENGSSIVLDQTTLSNL